MDDKITFESTTAGDWQVLKIAGRIDTITAPVAEAEALERLGAADSLALELADLEYISSAGLRILLRLAKEARRARKGFALACVHGLVKEVLEESGMDELFTVVETTAEL